MAATAVSGRVWYVFARPCSKLLFQVERAFKMYHSGECVDVGQFSCEKVSEIIDDYVVSLSKFSDRRWTKILDICGAHSNSSEDEPPSPGAQSMQNKRRTLYIPSSPTNED